MALRALLIKRNIDKKNEELTALREKDSDFSTRENELKKAIEEAESEEERKAVEEEVEKFDTEKRNHEDNKTAIEREIEGLRNELSEIEKAEPPQPQKERSGEKKGEERTMISRKFFNMNTQERDLFFARDDVKDFLQRTREVMSKKRAATGAELTIPTVMLGLIKENILKYSKLIGKVRTVNVNGKARQTIMGTIPEAVWTEACAVLNEINLQFNQVEVDGYKVGGFVAVCNAVLEDSDIELASEIISALGQAIGFALDKAILYGKGTKMPLGIVTRLAQTTEPSDYQANNIAWEDLHTTNIKKIDNSKTGAEFYAEFITAAGAAKSDYSMGEKFWAMNERTYSMIMAKSVVANMNGTFVASVNGVMPIVGGEIIVLPFIADNDIIGGYGDLYLLAEREGATLAQSTECKFIEDQTVFKGTARYDGLPVIPEGFVIINISGSEPTKEKDFADDNANNANLSSLKIGSETLNPVFSDGVYNYAITASGTSGKVEFETAAEAEKVVAKYNNTKVENGGTITFATGTKDLTIAVTKGAITKVYTIAITKA